MYKIYKWTRSLSQNGSHFSSYNTKHRRRKLFQSTGAQLNKNRMCVGDEVSFYYSGYVSLCDEGE